MFPAPIPTLIRQTTSIVSWSTHDFFSFAGTPEVVAPAHQLWSRLLDPQAVANAGPGVERVEVMDPQHFKVLTVLKLGSFKLSSP